MAKSKDKETRSRDFVFKTDADLNAQIAAFASAHEASHNERLAMDARSSLGAGKVRVTFRIVADRGGRGNRK